MKYLALVLLIAQVAQAAGPTLPSVRPRLRHTADSKVGKLVSPVSLAAGWQNGFWFVMGHPLWPQFITFDIWSFTNSLKDAQPYLMIRSTNRVLIPTPVGQKFFIYRVWDDALPQPSRFAPGTP